jgi:hypothetical protein
MHFLELFALWFRDILLCMKYTERGSIAIVLMIIIIILLIAVGWLMIESQKSKATRANVSDSAFTPTSTAGTVPAPAPTQTQTPAPASAPTPATISNTVSTSANPPVSNTNVANGGVTNTHATESSATFTISGNTLSVLHNGKKMQTISLTQEALRGLEITLGGADPFITRLDVNFDGKNDVGMFTSTAYGGVNNAYDFYIYNPLTHMLDKSPVLVELSSPAVNVSKKQVTSTYRSGPQWYTDTFTFDGVTYKKTAGTPAF